MPQSYRQILESIDEDIRLGRADQARKALEAVKYEGISTIDRRKLAGFARRLNLPEVSIRLLNPLVRPTGRKLPMATPADIAEYAAALVKIGALSEGRRLLESLDDCEVPDALLFRAFAYFAAWDYAPAIPLLDRYLTKPQLDERDRLIGLANLASALIYENDARARHALSEFTAEARRQKYRLAEGNALMLAVAQAVNEKDWKEATSAAVSAKKVLPDSASLDSFFVRKWEAVTALNQHRDRERLELVRAEALRIRHWETLRNCDFHEAIALRDESLFHKVYFGTPYESVRERLYRDFPNPPPVPNSWDWLLGESRRRKDTPVIELLSPNGKALGVLKTGSALQRLMGALCDDFYKPIRVADLFSRLYSDEYFNPETSPNRVNQLLKRLRMEFEGARLPFKIEMEIGAFRLAANAAVSLRVPNRALSEGRYSRSIDAIGTLFPHGAAFSTKEASQKLGVPLRTLHRDLMAAKEKGLIEQTGKGRAVKYRLVSALPTRRVA